MATNSMENNFINADDYFTNSDNINLLNINLNTKENNKWNRFSEWLHCICVVTFDLELGQAMEAIYPSHITLSDQVKNNVCYLAFPDSNSGCMGDTQFHIRLRVAPSTEHTFLKHEHAKFNGSCIPTHKADAGHYWGFVYFRQIRDSRLPRGYFQKSIVLLSRLPFVNLFYNICSLIAPKYFDEGKEVLERACDNICDWPALRAGDTILLPLLDIIFQTFIPTIHHFNTTTTTTNNNNQIINSNNINDKNNTNQSIINEMGIQNQQTNDEMNLDNNIKSLASMKLSSPTSSCVTPMPQVLSSVSEIDLFTSLYSVLSHVHLLWELVLTAEPIVVLADSPTSCSHMVQSLMSLISPLVYCAESRPYFTIHDSEFKEFTQFTQQNPPPSIILGVTNPFFSKTLQHWPHTIRLTLESTTTTTTTTNMNGTVTTTTVPSLSTSSSASATTTIGMGGKPSTNLTYPYGNDMSTTIIGDDHQFTTKFQSKLRKIKSITSSKLLDCTPGVYTQYKSFLEKDKNVIKKILLGIKTKRPAHVQSALLRRHLLELTQSFMIPLERYMTTLMPLQRDISPFKATPTPNQFKQDDFLATIDQFGPQLTSTLKGDWIGLYKRFFRSPNFKGWYEMRYNEITKTLQALQLHALSEADLKKWVQGKHEVEIVDMILKLKQKLKLCNEIEIDNPLPTIAANGALKSETKKQIITHLEDMNKLLPDDLRTILNNTKT